MARWTCFAEGGCEVACEGVACAHGVDREDTVSRGLNRGLSGLEGECAGASAGDDEHAAARALEGLRDGRECALERESGEFRGFVRVDDEYVDRDVGIAVCGRPRGRIEEHADTGIARDGGGSVDGW